ncbi:MAG: hypothetical protein K0S88_6154 [Actinomycetia bacterium]|nr:hypothetical protein [Actinomycetes bacterium]
MAQGPELTVQTFLFADLSGFTALTKATTGPAVERAGDWFGATVNLAARLSAAAAGGETLLTATTKAAAGQVKDVELRARGRWAFRNVGGLVEVYTAVRQGARSATGLPIDPVCRMAVDPWHGAGRLTHQGVEYCFCSLRCAGAFAQDRSRYTAWITRSAQLPSDLIGNECATSRLGAGWGP